MKRISASMIGAVVALSAFGGTFVDDFEDGVPNGWKPLSGEWEIRGGAYVLTAVPAEQGKAAVAMLDSPWRASNGVLSFTLRHDPKARGTERPMVYFRLQDGENGYAFHFRGDEKWMDIGQIIGGQYREIRGDATDAIDIAQPIRIKIEMDPLFFYVYYNDELRMRVGDPDRKWASGRIGLGGLNADTPIAFDDLRLEGDGVTQFVPDLRPVRADGRAATAWAALKRR